MQPELLASGGGNKEEALAGLPGLLLMLTAPPTKNDSLSNPQGPGHLSGDSQKEEEEEVEVEDDEDPGKSCSVLMENEAASSKSVAGR